MNRGSLIEVAFISHAGAPWVARVALLYGSSPAAVYLIPKQAPPRGASEFDWYFRREGNEFRLTHYAEADNMTKYLRKDARRMQLVKKGTWVNQLGRMFELRLTFAQMNLEGEVPHTPTGKE